jgi:hypothetical protein
VKKLLIAFGALALSIGGAGTALANGPSGSSETNNQVTCSGGQDVNGTKVYAGPNGAETCSDQAGAPVQGRIVVSSDGYASIDGDGSNDPSAQGFVRVDQNGPTCGGTTQTDSTAGSGVTCSAP